MEENEHDNGSGAKDEVVKAKSSAGEVVAEETFSPTDAPADDTKKRGPAALFRDGEGKPLFPLLYSMRQDERFGAMKQASQHAFSVAQSGLQRGFKVAQSKLMATEEEQDLNDASSEDVQVKTSFGKGTLVEFRETTGTYVVKLSSGGILYTKDQPTRLVTKQKTPKESRSLFTFSKKKRGKTVLEINETYIEWEKARQKEIEKECQQLNIPYTEETKNKCFTCLKEDALKPKTAPKPSSALFSNSEGKPMFPLLYKLRQSGQDVVKENTQHVRSAVTASESPCLLCASVCCSKHSSAAFRKQGVTLCLNCVAQLEDNNHEKAKLPRDVELETQRLVDLYGRALLLLQYCTPFIIPTADQLEQQTKQHNEIAGVGGSSAGLASGVLGVIAAATILTPVGPPLLIGSLVMGGSATAVQAGGEAYKYYSEPNQLANRILTLHGIIDMIMKKVKAMRETTFIPFLDKAISKLEVIEEIPNFAGSNQNNKETNIATRRAGTCLGSTAATSAAATFAVQEGAMAGRFVSRATTAAARTARVARFAGGALSAATLVLEARELRRTLDQMEKGNPCEKAQTLREVHAAVEILPALETVQRTCETYVKVRSRELFQQTMTEPVDAEGTSILSSPPDLQAASTHDNSSAPQEEDEWQLVEEVVASLEDSSLHRDDGTNSVISEVTFCNIDDDDSAFQSSSSIKPNRKASLLGRLVRFKEREARKEQGSTLDLVV